MQHIDEDLLALIALQAEQPDPDTAGHLDTCARCRDELAGLTRTVRAGRSGGTAMRLTPPPDRVWEAVTASLRDSGDLPVKEVSSGSADIEPLRRNDRRRSVPTWLAVAAGVVIGAVGAGVVVTATQPDEPAEPARQLIASAELDAFGDTGTPGAAQIYESDSGRVLHVQLDDRTPGQGFREVWLLDAETGRLVSLGVLNETESVLSIPEGLDLGDYPSVDVSREPLNGDPAHSGDSIARGELDL